MGVAMLLKTWLFWAWLSGFSAGVSTNPPKVAVAVAVDSTIPDFTGKKMIFSVKRPEYSCLLENVEVKRLGENSFFVGQVVECGLEMALAPGTTVWIAPDNMANMIEFKTLEDLKKAITKKSAPPPPTAQLPSGRTDAPTPETIPTTPPPSTAPLPPGITAEEYEAEKNRKNSYAAITPFPPGSHQLIYGVQHETPPIILPPLPPGEAPPLASIRFIALRRMGDEVIVQWTIDEKQLDANSIKVHFRPVPTSELREWKELQLLDPRAKPAPSSSGSSLSEWKEVQLPSYCQMGIRFYPGTKCPVEVRVSTLNRKGKREEIIRQVQEIPPSAATNDSPSPELRSPDLIWKFATRFVALPLILKQEQLAGTEKIRVYVSRDFGKTWQHLEDMKPTEFWIRYQAPEDGDYWFAIRIVSRTGQEDPAPTNDLRPEFKARVGS